MLEIKLLNEIIAIILFLLISVSGTLIVFGKKTKKTLKEKIDYTSSEKRDSFADKFIEEEKNKTFIEKLQTTLKQARININVNLYILLSIGVGIILATIGGLVFKGALFMVAFFGFGIVLSFLYIQHKRQSFIEKFYQELIKSLRRLSSVLRSGNSLERGLKEVVEDERIDIGAREEFAKVYSKFKAGFSIEESFYELYKSINTRTILYLCTSIDLQMSIGGDKAEIFDGIVDKINGDFLGQRNLKAKLADISASINMMACIPLVFIGIFSSGMLGGDLDIMGFYTRDFAGQFIAFIILSMIVFGYIFIKKKSKINLD